MIKMLKLKGTFNPVRIKKFDAEQLSESILILKIWTTDKSKQTMQITSKRPNFDFTDMLYYALYNYSGCYTTFTKEMIGYENRGEIDVTTLNIEYN